MNDGLERLLECLRRGGTGELGVQKWSLHASRSRRLALGIKDREAGNPHAPLELQEGLGARYLIVWDDGTISRGAFERRQLERDPAEALAAARVAAYEDPDGAHVLGPAPFPEVRLHDEATAAMARGDTSLLERRLALLRSRIGAASTWSGSFGASAGTGRLVTSAGLEAEAEGTGLGWWITVDGTIGDGFRARASESEDAFLARLDALMVHALHLRERAAGPGGRLPLLLHPRVVESWILATLLQNLEGSVVAHGDGRFRAEQFGSERPVLREDLTLRIDPLLPLRSGSYRFTSEGVPATPCTFLERGRLVQPVLDLKYARRLGLAPTPAIGGMDTLFFESGRELLLDSALAAAEGGVLVLSVLGVHTQDAASGDFSLSAPQALSIRSGGLRGRLSGTLSGNVFDVLQSPDLVFVRFPNHTTPGLCFPCRYEPR